MLCNMLPQHLTLEVNQTEKVIVTINLNYFSIDKALADSLTGGNWQNVKEYSWHIPAMKFIGMKHLV